VIAMQLPAPRAATKLMACPGIMPVASAILNDRAEGQDAAHPGIDP
jgi:hypothetical protein